MTQNIKQNKINTEKEDKHDFVSVPQTLSSNNLGGGGVHWVRS